MLVPDIVLQNRYRITRQMSKGGFGEVYLAVDMRFGDRKVAVKRALEVDAELLQAFEREARLLNDLRHPALPTVIDTFGEQQGYFLVMDFIEGIDLQELIAQNGSLPLDDILRWADQLCDALEYLHSQPDPVIHRDIKPQNIKVRADGRVFLLDFGLAKGAVSHSRALPAKSIRAGTLAYMPPEQLTGGTDARSDIYSLAATLYALLTGREPEGGTTRSVEVSCGRPDPVPLAHTLNPHVPLDISAVLERALHLDPVRRFNQVSAFRAALRAAQQSTNGHSAPAQHQPGAPKPTTAPVRQPIAATSNIVPQATVVVPAAAAAGPATQHISATSPVVVGAPKANSGFKSCLMVFVFTTAAVVLVILGAFGLQPCGWLDRAARISGCMAVLARQGPIRSVAYSATSTMFAATSGAEIQLWHSGENTKLRQLRGHSAGLFGQDKVTSLAFSPDGAMIVSGGNDDTVRLWRTVDAVQLRVLNDHSADIFGVAFAPDGHTVVSVSQDGQLRFWDVDTGRAQPGLAFKDIVLESVAYAPDGASVAVGGSNGKLYLVRGDTRKLLWSALASPPQSIAFAPNSTVIATGGADGRVRLWSATDGSLLRTLEGHSQAVTSVAFSTNGELLASAAVDGKVLLWTASDGALSKTLAVPQAHGLAFTDDDRTLIVGSDDGYVRLWDTGK